MAGSTASSAAEMAAVLARIEPAMLDGDGQMALARARRLAVEILDGLAPAGSPPLVDFDRYQRLLELAGPESVAELLDRLDSDLRNVAAGLARGLAEPSVRELRAQTHVLIALAGAVGAIPLQRLAEALNAAAHQNAMDEIARLGRLAGRQLDALAQFIAAERAAPRDGWPGSGGPAPVGAIPA